MPWSERCPRRSLQLLLVQCQNVILQRHDLLEGILAYGLDSLYVDHEDRIRTHDLLVISELEVILHHTIFIPGSVRTMSKTSVELERRKRTS